MTMQTRTHTKATDAIYAAVLAAQQNRPQLDPHDIAQALKLTELTTGWLRNTWHHLDGRPELQQFLKAAGVQLNALAGRLRDMEQGRAH